MPFKSAKQKKTIDAAAHNPAFAKKVGIKTSDAKKMSAHGKGQTKFKEDRTEVKELNPDDILGEAGVDPLAPYLSIPDGPQKELLKKWAEKNPHSLDAMRKGTDTSVPGQEKSSINGPRFDSEKTVSTNPGTTVKPTNPKMSPKLPFGGPSGSAGSGRGGRMIPGASPEFNKESSLDELRSEVKDKDGKVTSWKDEGEWKKANGKEGRGKVANLSDKARRETEKLSKAEKEMAESFEKAISEVKVTSGPNKGKQWSPKTPGPTNPNFKDDGSMGPPDGATAPPPGYKPPKTMKKAEVTPTVDTDDTAMTTAESSSKKVMKKLRAKHMMESIKVLGQLIAEAKKSAKKKNSKVKEDPNEGNAFGKAVADAKKDGIQKGEKVKVGKKEYPVKEAADDKCNHTPKGKKCPVHGLKECGSGMFEGNDGNLANNAKPYDKVTKGDVVAGRLGKDEMGGKSKKKKRRVIK